MFGMRHWGPPGGRWAARRGWRGGFGPGPGGGHRGIGGGDMIRVGRMLATGDLRLIALALIADQPRHGYEIIKILEEKTAGWYSPSPGLVYPTLTYLEEIGYVTAQAEGAKKLYAITDQGRSYLEQNRDFVDAVLARLAAFGEKAARMRKLAAWGRHDDSGAPTLPQLVDAALENLRNVAAERLKADDEAEPKVVDVLARAAAELRRL